MSDNSDGSGGSSVAIDLDNLSVGSSHGTWDGWTQDNCIVLMLLSKNPFAQFDSRLKYTFVTIEILGYAVINYVFAICVQFSFEVEEYILFTRFFQRLSLHVAFMFANIPPFTV